VPTPYNDIAHLLRRAGFGGLPNEISALAQLDLPDVVAHVLDTSQAPAVNMPSIIFNSGASWNDRYYPFLEWWFDRMASTPNPIAEKMTLFWHGHFTSSLTKADFQNMWNQLELFRTMGTGNFADLFQAVAISPAMLQWLDGATNVAGAPNENFARESMELFTIGVNQYTQADVTAAARAWTGHGISSDTHSYTFTANKHDNGQKTFLGITKNWNGPDIINELCLGSKMATTARFIANKLWTYFAYANPESTILDALTNTFVTSNLNIKSLLSAIFQRPEFYSDAARNGHVRSPAEYIVAIMRYTNLPAATVRPEWYCAPCGQFILEPPNVAGWGTGEYWVSAAAMWNRANVARNAMWSAKSNGLLSGTSTLSIQTAAQRVFDTFGIDEPSQATRSAIENAVYSERASRGYGEQQNLIQLGMMCPEFQAG
jgi:uncharacterized protein (DUF1800 family)